jgi:SAM-dependent methyltransferase
VDDLLELTRRAEADHCWFHGFRGYVVPALADIAAARGAGTRSLRMLECGCGSGANTSLLAPYGRAFGFDLTYWGAEHTRQRGVPASQADITRIPYVSGSFDIATAFDVLQCVPDDAAGVSEMARVVKPGGVVVLTLAAFGFLSGDHAEVWNEVRRYTPRTARQLVERAGLRAERVSFMFASLFPVLLALRTSQRLLRPYRPLRPDTDMAVPSAPINSVLTWMVTGEARVARHLPMPIGSSLLVVARKPA